MKLKKKTRKFWKLWNIEYYKNIPTKQLKKQNFRKRNITLNIPGKFQKILNRPRGVKFNQASHHDQCILATDDVIDTD